MKPMSHLSLAHTVPKAISESVVIWVNHVIYFIPKKSRWRYGRHDKGRRVGTFLPRHHRNKFKVNCQPHGNPKFGEWTDELEQYCNMLCLVEVDIITCCGFYRICETNIIISLWRSPDGGTNHTRILILRFGDECGDSPSCDCSNYLYDICKTALKVMFLKFRGTYKVGTRVGCCHVTVVTCHNHLHMSHVHQLCAVCCHTCRNNSVWGCLWCVASTFNTDHTLSWAGRWVITHCPLNTGCPLDDHQLIDHWPAWPFKWLLTIH